MDDDGILLLTITNDTHNGIKSHELIAISTTPIVFL